jgi:uncharacterized protein (DUF2235 family)
MAKNIVICCDGTRNEFGAQNSNVVKLYKTLVCDASQIAYYHPGVGTMGARNALSPIAKWLTLKIGLAFGYGISDNVADAYGFLIRTFAPRGPCLHLRLQPWGLHGPRAIRNASYVRVAH